jgi:hypothetical protein
MAASFNLVTWVEILYHSVRREIPSFMVYLMSPSVDPCAARKTISRSCLSEISCFEKEVGEARVLVKEAL